MQDLITQQTTDANQVAADNTKIVADQAQVATDQAQQTTDEATQATDAATFQAALAVTGPVGSLSPDGSSVEIYAAAGVVIQPNTPYPIASSVAVPAPPVTTTPPASS